MSKSQGDRCGQSEATCAYALQVLPASEVPAIEAHIAACPDCRRELVGLRAVVDRFAAWPRDVLRPTASGPSMTISFPCNSDTSTPGSGVR